MTDPARPASLSYSAVWNDTGRMLTANAGLLTAIAGALLFLPALLEARFFPPPEGAYDMTEWLGLMRAHLDRNWPWLLLSTTFNLIGVIAIYLLLLERPRLTVGAAVTKSLPLLPFYMLLTIILSAAIGFGFILLIVPGIFLLGKLVLATPILIAESPRAPFKAMRLAWDRSSGREWAIAGLLILVYLAAAFVSVAVRVGLGTLILLAFGQTGIGGLLLSFVQGLVVTAVTVLVIVLIAALYRAVTPLELGKRG